MHQNAAKFRKHGGEVYLPGDVAAAADVDAEEPVAAD